MAKDKYVAPAGDVVTARIGSAATGPRDSKQSLLETIMVYIRTTAAEQHDGVANRVPCPTKNDWQVLASGCNPMLPTPTRMNLYADEPMRDLAAKLGGIHQAYFAVAQYLLRRS